jgi:hypothetical protein
MPNDCEAGYHYCPNCDGLTQQNSDLLEKCWETEVDLVATRTELRLVQEEIEILKGYIEGQNDTIDVYVTQRRADLAAFEASQQQLAQSREDAQVDAAHLEEADELIKQHYERAHALQLRLNEAVGLLEDYITSGNGNLWVQRLHAFLTAQRKETKQ